jgi:hypothetical protein
VVSGFAMTLLEFAHGFVAVLYAGRRVLISNLGVGVLSRVGDGKREVSF